MKRNQFPSTNPYDTSECALTIERVALEVKKFAMRQQFDPTAMIRNTDVRWFHEGAARRMVSQIITRVASKKYETKTVSFPADWWQAVKRRFGPRWFLKRYPVVMTDVTMEASAYYPEVEIPDHAAFVEIMMNVQNRR